MDVEDLAGGADAVAPETFAPTTASPAHEPAAADDLAECAPSGPVEQDQLEEDYLLSLAVGFLDVGATSLAQAPLCRGVMDGACTDRSSRAGSQIPTS